MKLPAREFAGLSLGIEMVMSVVLCGAAGRWADGRYRSEPTFLLLGVVIGAAAGFRQIWRFMERMDQIEQRREREASADTTNDKPRTP